MSKRTTEITRSQTKPGAVFRDKQYYFNTLDIEHDLLSKAASIAERMMAAFMRENKVEVSINTDDIADKIIAKIGDKLQSHVYYGSTSSSPARKDDFNLDDTPVVFKTERMEVKGKVGTISQSGDSISDNMDMLEDLKI